MDSWTDSSTDVGTDEETCVAQAWVFTNEVYQKKQCHRRAPQCATVVCAGDYVSRIISRSKLHCLLIQFLQFFTYLSLHHFHDNVS